MIFNVLPDNYFDREQSPSVKQKTLSREKKACRGNVGSFRLFRKKRSSAGTSGSDSFTVPEVENFPNSASPIIQ